jgi:cellulose synthase/poly-beta-1,6-N-acetylglucosamine synthase-like glycosyltransferase
MIPESDWLRAVVAHAIMDPKMALVCPPQLFYNVPHNDPLAQSLDAFVHVVEPSKDATGVAWCTGSGYLIRRSALEAIGGWPIGSLAEDVCTSSLLLGAGWKTAYVHEPLQFGTVPDSYTGHLKQRTRWTLGTLQTATKLRFFFWGKTIKKMTFYQRLSGFVFSMDALFKMFLLISMATIPLVLVCGGQLVAYTTTTQLRWQIRLCTISLILTFLNVWITYLPSGYRLGRQETSATLWMAPYHAVTVARSFLLPKWLGGKALSFKPSGSIKDDINERNALHRAPLFRRLKVVLIDCGGIVHVAFVLFVIAAVIVSSVRAFTLKGKWVILEYLLTHVCWPPMLWVPMIHSCLVPLRYAIAPPSVPDREELLDRDPKTGVAHPKQEWKDQRWTKRNYFKEITYWLVALYTIALFAGTFTWQFMGPNHDGDIGIQPL